MKNKRSGLLTALVILAVMGVVQGAAQAVTNTWTGSTDTDWFIATNWSKNVVPSNGYHVVIDSISSTTNVLLTNSTASLASFNIISNTLIFTNWNTTLTASNVTIQSGGEITLPAAFTNGGMSNRVHIVCTNFGIEVGGTVNADYRGYAAGYGLGKGASAAGSVSGGGYGGKGGDGAAEGLSVGGSTYGSTNAPLSPGSGGGTDFGANLGGPGGGTVRIEATGNVTVNGMITANGENYVNDYGGGGSGGGIYITCKTFGGSANGILSANGGNGGAIVCGGGGGGRIAVSYQSLADPHDVRFSTSPGTGWVDSQDIAAKEYWPYMPGMGTLYFPDTNFLSETLSQFIDVRLMIPDFTSWDIANLTVNTGVVAFAEGDFRLTVTNELVIGSGGSLSLGGWALKGWVSKAVAAQTSNCAVNVRNMTLNGGTLTLGGFSQGCKTVMDIGENLTLTNGGSLHVYSGITNGAQDYGALVTVTGSVRIASSSWIYPCSNPTNGGSVLFRMHDLVISTNAGFNADYKGYAGADEQGSGYGPGEGELKGGVGSAGGGYGGKGGGSDAAGGGITYGSTNAPLSPGSGGGGGPTGNYGGPGGGAVRIEADDNVTVNGTITANGATGRKGYGGGGSGGGIYLICKTFGGSVDGILCANGGDGKLDLCGGGGGGRIAVWHGVPENRWEGIRNGTDMRRVSTATNYSGFSGMVSVTNGVGQGLNMTNAEPGTIVFLTVTPPSGMMFMCQ